MSLSVVLTVFLLVAVAELPDKTMIATVVMGSRSRPVLVWAGASAAFVVHVTLAVVAGRLLQLAPHRVVQAVVTVLFVGGACYLLFVPEEAQEEKGVAEADGVARTPPWKVVFTAFTVILVGEFGDLTQLLIVNFVAKYHQPASVFVGALAALVTISAIGAFSGRALLRVVNLTLIRRLGGVILLGFAGYNIYALVSR
ncbi:MAG TPA: TMEM165/GDT1 family protein [Acidimicrobiales bacterium]|nr:TMEM165/GDT1 family protein [Acidimicrobiales bacterium]